jgi:ribosomal protein L39E
MINSRQSAYYAIKTVKVFKILLKNTVIPAWMLESSHKDVKQRDKMRCIGNALALLG